jgi:D-serine deaminase-like pyridoxal phosphate-dependent protein
MKTPALAHLCIQAGAHGVTCAKLGEAEVMAAAGIRDILVANQIVGEHKVARLVNLCRHADVMVCIDDARNAQAIASAARALGVRPRLLIEVDVGMHRAGVPPGEPAIDLARRIAAMPDVCFAGLQTWESHALSITDADEKRRQVLDALRRVTDTADGIRAEGIAVDIISCGGTGTYPMSAFAPGITEIEAGGGIYGDRVYRERFGIDHDYALTVLSTVTSRPVADRIICDAGFKTMGNAHGEPGVVGIDAVRSFKLSAEHGVITLGAPAEAPRVGDKLEIVPAYSDSTVFLHDCIHGVRNGNVETVWPLLGRGKLR